MLSNVIEYDMRQREYDGSWERLAKVRDYENAYTYVSDSGYKVTHVPEKWLTIGVYDLEMKIDD